MKNVFFAIFALFMPLIAQSQSNGYKEILAYLRSQGYSISTEQVANLTQGNTAGHTKTFSSGLKYVIVACSDDSDVLDVDIFVNEMDGSSYTKDTDTKSVAVVEFNVYVTREMRTIIKNYSSRTPNYASTCRFVVAYKQR